MWNHDVVKAEGLVAFDARQVNVSQMMEFMLAFFQFASAQAIYGGENEVEYMREMG